MLHFRTRREAEEAAMPRAVREVVLSRIGEFEGALAKLDCSWDPDDDGWFSLLDPAEVGEPLRGMGWEQRLSDLLFEAVHYHPQARLWECIHIPGNNWGWTAFVPDSPGLPSDLREVFLREASEADAALARRSSP